MEPEDLSIVYKLLSRTTLPWRQLRERIETTDPAFLALQGDARWHAFLKLWVLVEEASLLGKFKAYVIYKHALRALELAGDFIECGVFRGGLSLLLGLMATDAGSAKKVFMCDNFEGGLPAPDRRVDKVYVEGTMACPVEEVADYISQLGLESRCILKKGLFSQTLPTLAHDQQFALAHLDPDLYAGTKDALEFIFPRLVEGAPVIVDDYYDDSHGVMQALNEFAEKHDLVIHLSVFGQAFFIKGESPGTLQASRIGPHLVYLTTEVIRQEPLFLTLLDAVAQLREEQIHRLRGFIRFCREQTPG